MTILGLRYERFIAIGSPKSKPKTQLWVLVQIYHGSLVCTRNPVKGSLFETWTQPWVHMFDPRVVNMELKHHTDQYLLRQSFLATYLKHTLHPISSLPNSGYTSHTGELY